MFSALDLLESGVVVLLFLFSVSLFFDVLLVFRFLLSSDDGLIQRVQKN